MDAILYDVPGRQDGSEFYARRPRRRRIEHAVSRQVTASTSSVSRLGPKSDSPQPSPHAVKPYILVDIQVPAPRCACAYPLICEHIVRTICRYQIEGAVDDGGRALTVHSGNLI
jgi:hypothetical protein